MRCLTNATLPGMILVWLQLVLREVEKQHIRIIEDVPTAPSTGIHSGTPCLSVSLRTFTCTLGVVFYLWQLDAEPLPVVLPVEFILLGNESCTALCLTSSPVCDLVLFSIVDLQSHYVFTHSLSLLLLQVEVSSYRCCFLYRFGVLQSASDDRFFYR